MPELPDIHYIVNWLQPVLPGWRIAEVTVKEPIVVRMLVPGSFDEILMGQVFRYVTRHGPFLHFKLDSVDIIAHLMLDGRFQWGRGRGRGFCFTLRLQNDAGDSVDFRYLDAKKMGKVYITQESGYPQIPGYLDQGADILASDFSLDLFKTLITGKRNQVRVFLMDHSILDVIGNAYADEILFSARIHPKALCSQLTDQQIADLHEAIVRTMKWGIDMVAEAGQPIEVKVRGHVRVRNRKGESCPECSSTIRRVGVLGYDSFFCPRCQPGPKGQKIPW